MTPANKEENRTIVIYGLNEHYNEHEIDLERKVIHTFMSVMNIDLTGYIEGIQRMGKWSNRRPIQVELISKRMTKYIINNSRQFKSTGLYVAEFLDQKSLQDRRNQRAKRYSTSQAQDRCTDGVRDIVSLPYRRSEHNNSGYQSPSQSEVCHTQTNKRTNRQTVQNTQNIGGTFRF